MGPADPADVESARDTDQKAYALGDSVGKIIMHFHHQLELPALGNAVGGNHIIDVQIRPGDEEFEGADIAQE